MTSTPWADGLLPLLETPSKTLDLHEREALYIANEMAYTHNAMIRGVNSISRQAAHIHEPKDSTDFLFLVATWCEWVRHHHWLEETIMFPGFEEVIGQKGYLDGNLDEHHAFSDGLKKLKRYAEETKAEDHDSPKIIALMNSFSAKLHEHLKDEIPTLLSMKLYDGPKLLRVYKDAEAEAGRQDKNKIPPLCLGCCDRMFEGGNVWPQMPWAGPYFVHFLMARQHAGSWRFLPADFWGKPRQLAFLDE